MTNRQIIAVVQAEEEGKQIEERNVTRTGRWRLCDKGHSWDLMCYEYRVKPEPREWWLVKAHPSEIVEFRGYTCKQYGADNIHVREVLE